MGWTPNEIARKLSRNFTDIAEACMMIGIARGVLIVMQHGRIMDTFVYGLSLPLASMPRIVSAECMLLVQTLLNFLIPSGPTGGGEHAHCGALSDLPYSSAAGGALLPVRGWTVQHPVAYGHGTGVRRHRRGEGPEVVEVVRASVPDAPGHPDGDGGHCPFDQLAVKKGCEKPHPDRGPRVTGREPEHLSHFVLFL